MIKKRRPRAGPPAGFLGPGLGPWPLALALDHHDHHDQDDDDYYVQNANMSFGNTLGLTTEFLFWYVLVRSFSNFFSLRSYYVVIIILIMIIIIMVVIMIMMMQGQGQGPSPGPNKKERRPRTDPWALFFVGFRMMMTS